MLVHYRKNKEPAVYDPETLATVEALPETPPCGPFPDCGACPYAATGFKCYAAEGDCLKTYVQKIKNREDTK